MRKWRRFWRMNANERRSGATLLLIAGIILILGLLRPGWKAHVGPDVSVKVVPVPGTETGIASGEKQEIPDTRESDHRSVTEKEWHLKRFDPNAVTQTQLVNMGVPLRVASNWAKYLQKGGYFDKPQTIARIYGMDSTLYEKLLSFVAIPDSRYEGHKKQAFRENKKTKSMPSVDLNRADTSTLQQLWGIGPYFAAKIVAYREQLGGYHHQRQLLEIWRMDSLVLQKNTGRIRLDTSLIRRWNVNAIGKEELAGHPYLSWKQANSIVNLRRQHGPFERLSDITRSVLIGDSLLNRLRPYLTVE